MLPDTITQTAKCDRGPLMPSKAEDSISAL